MKMKRREQKERRLAEINAERDELMEQLAKPSGGRNVSPNVKAFAAMMEGFTLWPELTMDQIALLAWLRKGAKPDDAYPARRRNLISSTISAAIADGHIEREGEWVRPTVTILQTRRVK